MTHRPCRKRPPPGKIQGIRNQWEPNIPNQNRDDAVEVETQIASIFASTWDGQANAIRRLFVETLDFDPASGQVSLASASANVQLPEAAERVAVLDGVQVLYAIEP